MTNVAKYSLPEEGLVLSDAKRKLLEKYLMGEIQQMEAPAAIRRRPAGVLPPLSFAQQQIWLHSQLAPGVPIYNEPMTISRTGPLDVALVERCIIEIIRRHEIWRTTFDSLDGQPVQIVHPPPTSFPLRVVDLRVLPEADREAEALQLVAEEGERTLDLKRGPLIRVLVLWLEDERYNLFFDIHQMILDGVTAYRGLFRELVTLYEAFSRGMPSPLPEPAIQYADYAVWHRAWVQNGKEVPRQMEYWEKKLAGDLPVLQWPNDRPRPPVQTFRGKVKSVTIPNIVVQGFKEFSRREGVTLYIILLAGFVVLMNRYTGQEDVIVGTVSANRKRCETETMMGYFLNPLPLRADVSGDPNFRGLLGRVRQVVSGALSNDDVPFEHLVKRFQKVRDLSRNPLFQTVVSLEPVMPSLGPDWNMVLGTTPTGASKLDLYVNFDERPEGLMATLTYNPDLFEDETITRIVGHWRTVLEAAIKNPNQKISELPLLTEAERHELLVDHNATKHTYAWASIPELFEAQVQKTPDAPAFIFAGRQITFKELNQQSNKLAHYLRRLGVGPEVLVGICINRSLEMVVGLLGIVKAGGAYVPLDPDYPVERLQYMLEDSNAHVMLTQKKCADLFPAYRGRLVNLDTDGEKISRESALNLQHHWDLKQLAYVIYTSGSTGQPKGVAVEQVQVLNRFAWMWRVYPFAKHEVSCQRTPLSFVDSIWEIFGPLLQGTATVIISDEVVKDPDAMVRVLAEQQVTRLWLVPSLLRLLLDTFSDLQFRLPRLKFWVSSGEPLPADLLRMFQKTMPHAVLYNLYGTSEVWDATWYDPGVHSGSLERVPIGYPIDNVQAYILDTLMQPVPVGVVGELYIGGVGLARGYLNRPELTADKFVPDPFSGNCSARLYRTGDLARYQPDKNIEHLGRTDRQVKMRGFRIELGEIESVLTECRGVAQGIVAAQDDRAGNKKLVAYVVPVQKEKPGTRELQVQMKRRLPEYMVPSAIVFLKVLPVLPNGKIDRQALPKPEHADHTIESEWIEPQDDLERQLLAMWEEVLGVQKIGVRDDFFELGGHSLLILILVSRIERTFAKKLSPAAIFQAPTVEQLAVKLRGLGGQLVQVMPIQPRGSKSPFFCISVAPGPLLRELAVKMGNDQPFLGLGFDPSALGHLETPYTLENIAGKLVRAILEHQSEGPYFVGGFCLNGLIAFETARQLAAQGQHVALLALFEAVNPADGDRFSQRSQLKTLAGRFHVRLLKNHLTSLYGLGTEEAKIYFQRRLKDIGREVRNLLWSSYVECRLKLAGNHLPTLRQILYVAARTYRPTPYTGRAVFFRCTDRRAIPASELERGWHSLLVDFQLHVLEGDHLGILAGPSLQILADKLRACLSDADHQCSKQGRKMS
jgi:surfactin family lipopeptide synthetase A